MIQVREFTEQGRREFEEYLNETDGAKGLEKPEKFNRPPYSQAISEDIRVDEDREFEDRLELGEYLVETFEIAGLERSELVNRENLWTWLAFVWLDQLVGIKSDGEINVKQISKYVCERRQFRYYKHLVALPYYLVSLHGSENSKFMLSSDLDIHKGVTEQLAGRRKMITNKELIKICSDLYWDDKKQKVKKNAGGRDEGPGTSRRLSKIIKQFRRTYDLHRTSADRLNTLLPREFDEWRGSQHP